MKKRVVLQLSFDVDVDEDGNYSRRDLDLTQKISGTIVQIAFGENANVEVVDHEEFSLIKSSLLYIYGSEHGHATLKELFEKLLLERRAGFYGIRTGNVIEYEGQRFVVSQCPKSYDKSE